jgi:rubrerythrin
LTGGLIIVTSTDLKAALLEAIQTEKDAMDYYHLAAEKSVDDRVRKTFELLSREERQHAFSFYSACKEGELPTFEQMMAAPPDTESSWFMALKKAMLAEFDERLALELAIEQEDALEKQLRAMAAKISDARIRAIYLANANSTHQHMEMVEEDYRAMLGMSS